MFAGVEFLMWTIFDTVTLNTGRKSANCEDSPKPPNLSYAQTVQTRLENSQFLGLSFTAIRFFFYINQPAQTVHVSSV